MTQYISKSALVAEIEKRIKEYKSMKIDSSYYDGMIASLEFLHDEFINTLEVKEVDLEKEYKDFIKNDNGRSMFETAKHFFELGMQVSSKAQKGEEV